MREKDRGRDRKRENVCLREIESGDYQENHNCRQSIILRVV